MTMAEIPNAGQINDAGISGGVGKTGNATKAALMALALTLLAACGSDSDDRSRPDVVYHGSDGYYRPDYNQRPSGQEQPAVNTIPPPLDMTSGQSGDMDYWSDGEEQNTAYQGGVNYLPGGGVQPRDDDAAQGREQHAAAQPPAPGAQPNYDPYRQADPYSGVPTYRADQTPGSAMHLQGNARIALLVPLSGPHADIGQALLRAAQMALFAHNADGVVLMPRDTQGRPDIAAEQARQVVREGADLILGPLFAEAVNAVAPEAQRAGISVIAFSNNRDVARPGVFLLGFLPEQQVTRVIRFAGENGLYRFAGLFPNNDYGRRVSFAFHDSVTRAGNLVAGTEVYMPTAEAMFDPVRRLTRYDERVEAYKEQVAALEAEDTPFARAALERMQDREAVGDVGFDAVLLPAGGTDLKSLAPLLPYYEVDPKDVKFLGTGLWGEAGIGLEPSLVGGWYAGPPPGQEDRFITQFDSVFGKRPPRLASLGFDAMSLAVALHQTTNHAENPSAGRMRFSQASITRPQGFAGMDGIFRFHETGLNERGLAIIEVKSNGMRVIDPAPTRFDIYDARWQQDTPAARQRQRLTYPGVKSEDDDWQQRYVDPGFGDQVR